MRFLLCLLLLVLPSITFAGACQSADAAADRPGAAFSDLRGHWAAKAVAEMTQAGVIKGFPDGTFRPNAPVTEEQFFSMIERMLPPIANRPFDPFVEETYLAKVKNRWSEPTYRRLMVAGIASYGEPQGSVKRVDAAQVLLMALASQSQGEQYRQAKKQYFRDVPLYRNDGPYGTPMINEAEIIRIYPVYKMGVMSGFTDGTFRPNQKVTRAEAAVLLQKLSETKRVMYPDNVDSAVKQKMVKTLGDAIQQVMDNRKTIDGHAGLISFAKEKKLPVTEKFLDEHFDFMKYEATDFIAFPRFDELVYISKLSATKYRVTVQYYSGELGGSVDRTFYLSSNDGEHFQLIGKNE